MSPRKRLKAQRRAQAESGEKRRSVNPVEGRGKMTEKRSETTGDFLVIEKSRFRSVVMGHDDNGLLRVAFRVDYAIDIARFMRRHDLPEKMEGECQLPPERNEASREYDQLQAVGFFQEKKYGQRKENIYRDAKRQMPGDLKILSSGLESESSDNVADLIGGVPILGSSA
jgi:hypothetical protein